MREVLEVTIERIRSGELSVLAATMQFKIHRSTISELVNRCSSYFTQDQKKIIVEFLFDLSSRPLENGKIKSKS